MMIIVGATALANTGIGASQNSVWVIWAWLALPLLVTVFVIIGIRNGASRTVRVQRFASVNNLSYTTSLRDPTYKGMIFQFGRDRCIREELTIDTSSGNGAQIGTYQCVTGSGRSQHTHRFSYIRYTLSRQLPHMVLDGKKNNLMWASNLPTLFDKDQILHLEGNFDEHYTLYAPQDYQVDALAIFTPDVMSAFINSLGKTDAEIIDNELYVYVTSFDDLGNCRNLDAMLQVADILGGEVEHQAGHYTDQRVVDRRTHTVASAGQRLKTRINWVAVILMVGYFAIFVFDKSSTFTAVNDVVSQAVSIIIIVVMAAIWVYRYRGGR